MLAVIGTGGPSSYEVSIHLVSSRVTTEEMSEAVVDAQALEMAVLGHRVERLDLAIKQMTEYQSLNPCLDPVSEHRPPFFSKSRCSLYRGKTIFHLLTCFGYP